MLRRTGQWAYACSYIVRPTKHAIFLADQSVGIVSCSLWSMLTSVQTPKLGHWVSQKRVWENAGTKSPSHLVAWLIVRELLQGEERKEGMVMSRKTFRLLLMLAIVGVAAGGLGQNQNSTQQDIFSQDHGNAIQSRSSALRILEPRSSQTLSDNFVTVRFELVRPNPAGGGNNFVIQLDGNAPVNTSESDYTFTGMRSGQHILTVREVDANGTPMPDAGAEVQFSVKPAEGTMPAQSGGTTVPSK
jgi:hypothetical protein